ncbi:cytochrome P450, partial [Parageobacillus sp. SY1]
NIEEMLNGKSLISDDNSLIHNIQKDHSLSQKEKVAFIFPFFEMLASKMTHELPVHLIIKIASHRVVQQRVREHPEELSKVVHEVARGLEGLMLTRFAKEDVEINGKQIKKGDKVAISITHTNKDNRVFKNPTSFNPWRLELKESLSFGAGEHRCLGKGIAIHLSMTAVQALIDVTEFIEPGGDIHHIQPLWKPFEK